MILKQNRLIFFFSFDKIILLSEIVVDNHPMSALFSNPGHKYFTKDMFRNIVVQCNQIVKQISQMALCKTKRGTLLLDFMTHSNMTSFVG